VEGGSDQGAVFGEKVRFAREVELDGLTHYGADPEIGGRPQLRSDITRGYAESGSKADDEPLPLGSGIARVRNGQAEQKTEERC
jgi:hypothetical protein